MFYSNNPLIKHKTGLLNLAEELGNISQACKVMGMSRDTFYRYQQAVEQGGVEALLNQNRRVPNLKNRVDEAIEQAVVKFALDNPAFGQVRVSNELRKQGIFVSAGGVRSIWLRHHLANFKQRLIALEKLVAEQGIILSETQVQALERKKKMRLPVVKLKRHTLAILAHKILSMWATSKEWVVFINKRLLILTVKWRLQNFIQ
ncbi:hypothetical protein ADNJHIED_01134 [Mannheimia haemolytica]